MLKRILLALLLISLATMMFAQEKKTITGIVLDAMTKEPLIGAVIVDDTKLNGTVTDFDGNFSIDTNGKTITVSYVGYAPQVFDVATSKNLNVLMKSTDLDEVVVIGYTSMKKRDVLGSIAKVNSKDLSKVPVASASEALQGRVSGVQVTSATGAPGAGVSVRVRGVGSVNSGTEPLYIIDGIPVEGGLNSINPSDIDNVTVLKDASSAAVYGSRAGNGVVLITTKKGVSGPLKVSYNGQTGVQTHGHLTKMASSSDYVNIYNAAATNDGGRPLLEGTYLKDFGNTNHLEEIFRTAWINSHELSLRAGTKKLNYVGSFGYFNQEGIILDSGFEKVNGRISLNYEPISKLKVGFDVSYANEKTDVVPSSGDGYGNSEGGSVVRYAMMRNPSVPTYNADGSYVDLPSAYYGDQTYNSFFGDGYNPVGLANMANRKKNRDVFFGKVYTEVSLPYNTTWKTNFGVDYAKLNYKIKNETWGTNDRINNPRSENKNIAESFGWTLNSVFNSIHTFNDVHNFTFMAGTEAIRYHGHDSGASSSVNGDTYTKSLNASSLFSVFSQANYNYNNKYYLSALVREDGSSRFTKGNRWGTFYSFGAGWDVNEESFMKSLSYISLLKLRAGYGVVGNQSIPLYAYTDQYNYYYNYPFNNNSSLGMAQTNLGNEKLKWERSEQFNLGIDMTFEKGKYGFSVDYYNKISKDMLLRASLPPSAGYASPYWINAGSMRNRGIDVEVFMRHQYAKGGFSVNVNWSYLNNKVTKLNDALYVGRIDNGIYAMKLEEGRSIGSFYLYEMDGIFQNEAEIVKSAYQGSNVKPGDVKYTDVNGDGVIDENDRKFVGSSLPKQTLGINLAGNYQNWDISVFFQGAFGQKIYNQISTETEGFYRGFAVSKDYYDGYWKGEGTSNEYPRASWEAKSNNVMASTRFLENGSYLRLKNIQLGYTFPPLNKYISTLRVYGSITNLLTFTKYKGLDPEMTASANAAGEGDLANGIDWGTYPVAKAFTLGVNITF